MYVLPLNMMVATSAGKSSVLDGPLIWEDMYALGDELKACDPGDGMALTIIDYEFNDVYNLIHSYVDYETMTSYYARMCGFWMKPPDSPILVTGFTSTNMQ